MLDYIINIILVPKTYYVASETTSTATVCVFVVFNFTSQMSTHTNQWKGHAINILFNKTNKHQSV